jgi:hypothetical protein
VFCCGRSTCISVFDIFYKYSLYYSQFNLILDQFFNKLKKSLITCKKNHLALEAYNTTTVAAAEAVP